MGHAGDHADAHLQSAWAACERISIQAGQGVRCAGLGAQSEASGPSLDWENKTLPGPKGLRCPQSHRYLLGGSEGWGCPGPPGRPVELELLFSSEWLSAGQCLELTSKSLAEIQRGLCVQHLCCCPWRAAEGPSQMGTGEGCSESPAPEHPWVLCPLPPSSCPALLQHQLMLAWARPGWRGLWCQVKGNNCPRPFAQRAACVTHKGSPAPKGPCDRLRMNSVWGQETFGKWVLAIVQLGGPPAWNLSEDSRVWG